MAELNLLTRRLFAAGWTKEKHPDYVKDWNYTSEFTGASSIPLKSRIAWCL